MRAQPCLWQLHCQAAGAQVCIRDAASFEVLRTLTTPSPVEAASYCPERGRLVAGGADMWVHLYDVTQQDAQEIDCCKGEGEVRAQGAVQQRCGTSAWGSCRLRQAPTEWLGGQPRTSADACCYFLASLRNPTLKLCLLRWPQQGG